MIILTIPAQINSVLGGNTPVAYDHLTVSPMTFNPVNLTITGTIRIVSTANPTMQAITGSFTVDASSGVLEISVSQLDFYRRIMMSPGQILAAKGMLNNAQNAIEAGLISMGILDGTQSTGV